MIRFSCPNCGRAYVLLDALARIPLLCKGCGQRLTPPDPEPEPPASDLPLTLAADEPAPADLPLDVTPAEPSSILTHPAARDPDTLPFAGPAGDAREERPPRGATTGPETDPAPLLTPAARAVLNAPAPRSPVPRPAGAVAPPAAEPLPEPAAASTDRPTRRGGRVVVGLVVDVVVGLLLVVVGSMLGEMLARKSAAQVIRSAGSAAKFPPVDLVMWAAPPLLLALVYVALAGRGRSVGGWLRRRAA